MITHEVDKMDAIFLINKPKAMTSFDVCFQIKKSLHEKSVGHTGTLDPNATGLLIVLCGKYTKLLPYCDHDRKEYIASMQFGIKTDTLDIWGNVIDSKPVNSISEDRLKEVLNSFLGKQKQIPPMYSAIKKDGKKLYELARNNIEIVREARDIEIYEIELLSFNDDTFSFRAVVSSGTYIRSLCEDIASRCDNYGVMTSLNRTKIQDLSIDMAINVEDINEHLNDIKPYDVINNRYPKINVSDKMVNDIKNGKRINVKCDDDMIILVNNDTILAAYEKAGNNVYKCKRGLF